MRNFSTLRDHVLLRTFAFFKVPMLSWLAPSLMEIDDDHCVLRFPLGRRSKNHMKVMYVGVLCSAADAAGGVLVIRHMPKTGQQISYLFKDLHAHFLKRAESDVLFTCSDGSKTSSPLPFRSHSSCPSFWGWGAMWAASARWSWCVAWRPAV